jgi:preprotein translocase subunit SecE
MSKNKLKLLDIGLWLGVLLVTIVAIITTNFAGLTGPIVAIVWILWLLLSLVLSYFTEKGKVCFEFVKESKAELEKVVWPNKQETTQTTLIVIVMVAVTGVVLWCVDSSMTWAIGKVTQLG